MDRGKFEVLQPPKYKVLCTCYTPILQYLGQLSLCVWRMVPERRRESPRDRRTCEHSGRADVRRCTWNTRQRSQTASRSPPVSRACQRPSASRHRLHASDVATVATTAQHSHPVSCRISETISFLHIFVETMSETSGTDFSYLQAQINQTAERVRFRNFWNSYNLECASLQPNKDSWCASFCANFSMAYSEKEVGYTGDLDIKRIAMVALWNRADHYIFALWFLSFFYHFFLSPPNVSGRRLDVYTILRHMMWP